MSDKVASRLFGLGTELGSEKVSFSGRMTCSNPSSKFLLEFLTLREFL